ncbi:Alpha-amylase [Lactiplantibacillus plantarum subsp. plantarum]|uniref:Alpha-amylase n=1 Tax=Lactiplantibacillus plantarum subsp. plantarum TaxID=337330 RepID=A0A2S3U923_LACPN|nr:Alpha-amylase [Lactiplantibacillus plantarum subsp. plantarum]
MPIYPVGQKNRKGSLGSPYAISDYRAINPELGTMSDFVELCNAIHDQGMKVIIDIVYNHTSPDSELLSAHPDWFYHHSDGSLGNRVADWSDIIDLDYQNHDLWQYQIDTLKKWAQYVDGFRCDVAPLVSA